MTHLHGFGDKAVRKKDYKCDCSLCGGNQDNWTTLSETEKMVKALILKAQWRLNYQRHASHFKRIRKNTAFVVKCNGWRAICRKPSTPYMM